MPGAPFRLRCEFASNPLGVTRRHPRLSWWVNDAHPAELQSAYEILAASSVERLAADEADLWHSGRVESDRCSHIPYAGPALVSGQRVWWKVRTFDSDGVESPWSEPVMFQCGLAEASEWQGQWMTSPLRGSRSRGVHAVALRREFVLTEAVARASLFICALGDYRVQLNGRVVPGADCNASWSDFSGQAYYQAFEVGHLLKAEPNCLALLLSDGYYAGALPGAGRANYGDRPLVLVQLEVTLTSGQKVTVSSDGEWLWRPSWILAADINGGEHMDARQYIEGWSEPGLDTTGWSPIETAAAAEIPQKLQILSQPFAGFSARQILHPLEHPRILRHGQRYSALYDFGEALVGRVHIAITSRITDEIIVSYALQPDFSGASEDTYTCDGCGEAEVFSGQFALHSFRYLRVEYTGQLTEIGEVNALRMTNAETPSLLFGSDHASLNKLFAAVQSSLQNVAQTVPMRGMAIQERLPDAAYAATWVPFFAQQTHARSLVEKWVADLRFAFNAGVSARLSDEPVENSAHHSFTVPPLPRANDESDEFARFETLVRTVWALYRYQNDVDLLRECYGELRVAALSYKHAHGHYLRTGAAQRVYGDAQWSELVGTSCMHSVLRTTARIAGVLGHLGDYELLENLADEVRKAFRRRYLSYDGHLLGDGQSAYVAALYHQMLDEGERATAQQRLVELLQEQNYHIQVAPILVHALLPVLTDAARLDVAYMVLLQTSAPSWLAAVEQHPGCIGREPGEFDIANIGIWEWLLESLIGLRPHEDYSVNMNGYRSVRIRPMPPFGAQFLAGSPVRFVEAALQTLYGQYEIKWWIKQDCFELELLIPPSCRALVTMPDGIEQQVHSGHHRFVMDFGAGGDGVPTLLDLASSNRST